MALKVAVVLLADVGSPGDMGRMANALVTAQECNEAGDEAKLIFDGAGTKWIPELSSPGHKYHALFMSVRESVAGVCQYCAGAYGVADRVRAAGFELTDQYQGHPSLRQLIAQGFHIITF